jgi:hypothetical protein
MHVARLFLVFIITKYRTLFFVVAFLKLVTSSGSSAE